MIGLLGVVLCGGKSTRMGRDKASLDHPAGVTFLQHSANRLRDITDEIVIVGGPHQVSGATTIADRAPDQGPAVGVLTAIEFAIAHQFDACLVTAVDLPHLAVADLCKLIEIHQTDPTTVTCASSDRAEPLIAIYPVGQHETLRLLTKTKHRSLSRWLESTNPKLVPLPTKALHNTNTPTDLPVPPLPVISVFTPDEAIASLAEKLTRVPAETTNELIGRILAEDCRADRDSPAADVSAMDGYAVRLSDLREDLDVHVSGQSVPGSPPPDMIDGQVTQIFTGGIVPAGAAAVIQREQTIESEGSVRFLPAALQARQGTNIRFAGENLRSGETYLKAGCLITAPQAAAMTNFGVQQALVFRKLRIAIVTTGDEVQSGHSLRETAPALTAISPEARSRSERPLLPHQIYNSNRTALLGLLSPHAWIESPTLHHVRDHKQTLRDELASLLADHDAIILTGGVSAGDHDYVPGVVRDLNADVVFHKLPIRPGKPILGAATVDGKLILGLPGNPVSATMGGRRFVLPMLRRIAGQTQWQDRVPVVRLVDAGEKTLPLHWMRGVHLTGHGTVTPVIGKGSGDLVALAQTDGFIEMPPHATGEGPWPYWAWS